MSVVITNDGAIKVTGQTSMQMLSDLIGDMSIASIALTIFNFLTAGLTILLILVDNRRIYKTWKLAPSIRIPLGLSIAICVSHVVFILKAFIGLAVFRTFNPPSDEKLPCKILNELGFWGRYYPSHV
jgi:formate hydrogenlyase subunit 3/multisubunit Na+/H+ antiporter MnhD subunit